MTPQSNRTKPSYDPPKSGGSIYTKDNGRVAFCNILEKHVVKRRKKKKKI